MNKAFIEEYIKIFCRKLKELCARVVNYEMKDMIPLTDNENKYYNDQERCYIYNKRFCYDKSKK